LIIKQIQTATTTKHPEIAQHQFAEAIAFHSLIHLGQEKTLVVYTPLEKVHSPLRTIICGKWSANPQKIFAMETDSIRSLVGIWEAKETGYVYMLRKHPGPEMLDASQCGLPNGMDKERDDVDGVLEEQRDSVV
jgi:hypothetical protein